MNKKLEKAIYWAPRVLSILFILFLAMFSLDVLDMGLGFWGTVGAFLIHNIPVFILIAAIVVSWKYEIVGGITYVLAGLLYVGLTISSTMNGLPWYLALSWSMTIAVPAIFIGVLWLMNWYVLKKKPLPGKGKTHKKHN